MLFKRVLSINYRRCQPCAVCIFISQFSTRLPHFLPSTLSWMLIPFLHTSHSSPIYFRTAFFPTLYCPVFGSLSTTSHTHFIGASSSVYYCCCSRWETTGHREKTHTIRHICWLVRGTQGRAEQPSILLWCEELPKKEAFKVAFWHGKQLEVKHCGKKRRIKIWELIRLELRHAAQSITIIHDSLTY